MTIVVCSQPECDSNQFNIVRNVSEVFEGVTYFTFICRECYSTRASPSTGLMEH